jgi:hypothetical protein
MRSESWKIALGPISLTLCLLGCGSDPLPATTVEPPGGPAVTVAVAAVALAGDCSGISSGTSNMKGGACPTATPDCVCRQSTVQLKVSATDGTRAVTFQVVSVRILDPSSGAQLDKLTARSPQKWSGNTYVDWDQTIAPLDDFAASYKTSAPNWTVLSGGRVAQTAYRVEVDLLIDGQARTISIDGVTREPPIST